MDGKCTGTSTPTELRESQDSMTRDAHLDGYFVGKSLTKSKDLNTGTGGQWIPRVCPEIEEFNLSVAILLGTNKFLKHQIWG